MTRKEIINLLCKYMMTFDGHRVSFWGNSPKTYFVEGEWWRYRWIKRYWISNIQYIRALIDKGYPADAVCKAASIGHCTGADKELCLYQKMKRLNLI